MYKNGKSTFNLNNEGASTLKHYNMDEGIIRIEDTDVPISVEAVPTIEDSEPLDKGRDYINDVPTNISIDYILDYINSELRAFLAAAITFDDPHITSLALKNRSKAEKVLMLADFVLNYKGSRTFEHMCLFHEHNIFNSLIDNIPIFAFARLNRSDVASIMYSFGIEYIDTAESRNIRKLNNVAKLFNFNEPKYIKYSDLVEVLEQINEEYGKGKNL